MESIGIGLYSGKGFRYTTYPPKVRKYTTKLDLTYRRRCNAQWERLPMLRDRKKAWSKVANGHVWDREKERFVILDVPYEIADFRGNIKILNI